MVLRVPSGDYDAFQGLFFPVSCERTQRQITDNRASLLSLPTTRFPPHLHVSTVSEGSATSSMPFPYTTWNTRTATGTAKNILAAGRPDKEQTYTNSPYHDTQSLFELQVVLGTRKHSLTSNSPLSL